MLLRCFFFFFSRSFEPNPDCICSSAVELGFIRVFYAFNLLVSSYFAEIIYAHLLCLLDEVLDPVQLKSAGRFLGGRRIESLIFKFIIASLGE